MKKRTISVVIPVYNESGNIERLYKEVVETFSRISYTPECIFVDDGSTDGSTGRIESLAASDPRVKLVQFSRNFGKEAATSAGLCYADGDAAVIIDADLQHPPAFILEFVKRWEEGSDVVIGVRRPRVSEGLVRNLGSRLFAFSMNLVGDAHVPQGATDFRLVDRAVVQAFRGLQERGRMTRALIDWLGFKRTYLYFDAAERMSGTARYGYRALARLAVNAMVAHSRLPLQLTGYLGAFIVILAGGLGLFVVVEQFLLGDPLHVEVSGTAMLAILILFLNGIVLISLGLMSLYIGTIYEEAVKRPLFIVRRTVNLDNT